IGGSQRRRRRLAQLEHSFVARLVDENGTHGSRMTMACPGSQRYMGGDMMVAVGGLVVALAAAVWWLARRLREAERSLAQLRAVRRQVEDVRGGFERGLAVTRTHLAEVAAGGATPPGGLRARRR